MRYQQMFAALTVKVRLMKVLIQALYGILRVAGKQLFLIILLMFYLIISSKQNKVAKFYFIVDRLDLLKQASEEFEARGLVVKQQVPVLNLWNSSVTIRHKKEIQGKPEITVVNIQRFAEDGSKVDLPAYATNLQRVFIIDEAHRGYKPEGSFLANLLDADKTR